MAGLFYMEPRSLLTLMHYLRYVDDSRFSFTCILGLCYLYVRFSFDTDARSGVLVTVEREREREREVY